VLTAPDNDLLAAAASIEMGVTSTRWPKALFITPSSKVFSLVHADNRKLWPAFGVEGIFLGKKIKISATKQIRPCS